MTVYVDERTRNSVDPSGKFLYVSADTEQELEDFGTEWWDSQEIFFQNLMIEDAEKWYVRILREDKDAAIYYGAVPIGIWESLEKWQEHRLELLNE